jgi:hypothetical protein
LKPVSERERKISTTYHISALFVVATDAGIYVLLFLSAIRCIPFLANGAPAPIAEDPKKKSPKKAKEGDVSNGFMDRSVRFVLAQINNVNHVQE